jgi:hydroxymethylbilane synthase
LALRQSEWVKAEIERRVPGLRIELLPMGTTGDRLHSQPLPQIGGKGLFTQELEEALLRGEADFAVHSLKDLPTELAPGLTLAAIPEREDCRDAFLGRGGRHFVDLPKGGTIGTSSVRRAAQLRRLRPDVRIEPLRGNLDTRLRKLREGPLDAMVLAAAGLHRMGWKDQITEYFPADVLCPAVGQGALGIEARSGDSSTLTVLAAMDDFWARISATAERALLRHLGGGCQIPIAAYTHRENDGVILDAVVIRPDGSEIIQARESSSAATIDAAEALGHRTADSLLSRGAWRILESLGSANPPSAAEAP